MALRAGQYRVFSDPERALGLARAVVAAKIANQRTLLMRSLRGIRDELRRAPSRDQSPPERRSVSPDRRGRERHPATRLPAALPPATSRPPARWPSCWPGSPAPPTSASCWGWRARRRRCTSPTSGGCSRARSPGAAFDFTARNRRPPRDPVNALLSFAYALLAKDCFSAACTVGFDPYHGFYHVGRHGRPSLALDLMEEFRPVIADSVVLNLINNGMLTSGDFLTWRDACQLTDAGREAFFKAYEQRKATEVTHPVFGYRMSYGRMLEVQARMLAAYVRGESPRYVGLHRPLNPAGPTAEAGTRSDTPDTCWIAGEPPIRPARGGRRDRRSIFPGGDTLDTYLVAYDISNPKRLRKVARTCEDFGLRRQFSVFFCRLCACDLVRLKSRFMMSSIWTRTRSCSSRLRPVCRGDRDPGSADRAA